MNKKEFATAAIATLKAHNVNWSFLNSEQKFIRKVEHQLAVQQETNLFDFEDIVNTIMFKVVQQNTVLPLGSMIKKILLDHGNFKSRTSPEFTELFNQSSDDDGTGAEDIQNDMGVICGPDIGAGSDAHIALLDIGTVFGEGAKDVFECAMSGCSIADTCEERAPEAPQHWHTIDTVKKTRAKLIEWLGDKGYTLDTSNRRLGTKSSNEDFVVTFNASRKQSVRNWDLPSVDHRSTKYTDIPKVDYEVSYSRDHEHNSVQCEGWFGTATTTKQIAKAFTDALHCLIEGTGESVSTICRKAGYRSETWVATGFNLDTRATRPGCFLTEKELSEKLFGI
jgi:hypothetical protein